MYPLATLIRVTALECTSRHIVRGNEVTSESSESRSLLPNDFGLIRATKASQTRNLFRIAVVPNLAYAG